MNERLAREREFHDARFAEGHEGRNADRFYAISEASSRYFKQSIEAVPPGGQMLDYGCGAGAYAALHAAEHGHWVTAIDISPVAIKHAQQKAERRQVADRIDFRVENAEDLELASAFFDIVCGVGVIHHLNVASALREVARVTRPSGAAVFVEPLGHNPIINLYRRCTPDQRSADEHPLMLEDFDVLRAQFSSIDVEYFHLLGLLALPFTASRRFRGILGRLDAADRLVFRTPARRWAWMAGIRLTGPLAPRPITR